MAGMQPGGAPQEGAPQAEGSGDIGQFIGMISDGLSMLAQGVSGMSPEGAKKLEAINQQFQATVQEIVSAGQGGGAQGSVGAPETGGAQGAVPAGPQGVR